ncbi:hypothetical protein HMPREF3069_13390 [Achromobacter xylosoxidans]|nr:hypothetical protein ABW35_01560 [Achromobacter xylosoxidans]KOQ31486.1 hypothetical protein ABW34_00950 [Achromobacter xylosoxidans]KOQ34512.1 hypothetical protein ABW36_05625 [Achromobacter xylosoxidans]KOQ47129.1 hypothetical protein ABW37_00120 [Achromobacter xylosoxidans]KOQ49609.1 hypothetical protein ABW39_08045 [Achromobacter xylosoxidans]
MNFRVAIYLTGRSLEYLGLHPLGKPQHVDGTMHAGLGGLHRVELVMYWRSRTCEIVDFVNLDIERNRHIMTHGLEMRVRHQMGDIILISGEIIIDTQHIVALIQKALTQVRTQKTGPTSHKNTFHWICS